jgi:hypothetical protein
MEIDRSTRLLALVQQREDELVQLKSQRSDELTRLCTLLQKREEEIAELKAQKLNASFLTLTRQVSSDTSDNWAFEVEKLRAEMVELTATYEQELQKARSLLQQCEEDLTRTRARHSEEMAEKDRLLKEREGELADLKTHGIMASNRRYSSLDIENLHQSIVAMQNENLNLRSEVHEKKWSLERLETQAEKDMQDSLQFVKRLASSSARSCLDTWFDMSSQEFLGMGNYGYVMTCRTRKTGDRVVVKLQSERWVGLALTEWSHGSEVGEHPNIVEHLEIIMHYDEDGAIRRRLVDAFDRGILTGRRPKFFPTTYFCLAIEYMDRGNVQNFIDKGLLEVEGLAAIAHQVASALAFMHKKKRTHNDIKPENILLCLGPQGDCLLAKLADLGLADHSMDQRRDRALFAYTVWCAGLHRQFERCPATDNDRVAACDRFSKAVPSTSKRDQNLWRGLSQVIEGMWLGTDLTMRSVEDMKVLQNLKIKAPVCRKTTDELEDCAKREIGKRQERTMDKWKLLKSKSRSAFVHDDEDDFEGNLAMNGCQLSKTWPPAR